jgi:hypothetical protein
LRERQCPRWADRWLSQASNQGGFVYSVICPTLIAYSRDSDNVEREIETIAARYRLGGLSFAPRADQESVALCFYLLD